MKPHPKIPPATRVPPDYRAAFARLDDAVANASTAGDVTTSDKLNLLRVRLFGEAAIRVIAEEKRRANHDS